MDDRVGPQLGGRPRRGPRARARRPQPARHRGRRADGVRARLHDVPAAHLRALPQPVVRGLVPVRRDVQARGGRHRPGRPGGLPGLAHVRLQLPLQEGLLQLADRQGREVHPLLPAHRGRACRRSAPRPAWGASATSASSSTTPTAWRRRPRSPTRRTCSTPSSACSSTPRIRRCAAQAEIDGIPADWMDAARRSPVYALAMRYRVALPLHPEYRTLPMVWYVPPLSPVMGMIEGEGSDGRPRRRLPGDRPAADPGALPLQPARGRRRRGRPPRAQAARRDAPLHARARRSAARPTPRSPPRWAWTSATWRTCTGCWRSPSTTSASSSRRPTPSWPGRCRPSRAPAGWTSPAARRVRGQRPRDPRRGGRRGLPPPPRVPAPRAGRARSRAAAARGRLRRRAPAACGQGPRAATS